MRGVRKDASVSRDAGVSLDLALEALTRNGASLLRPGADGAVVLDVVLHAPGDPAPAPDTVVLWADVEGPVPNAVAVVMRTSASAAAGRLGRRCAVLTVPDGERWASLHERLRSAVLASGEPSDLFAMADALAITVGGAVAIEDVGRRILAFSTVPGQPIDEVRRQGILGRRVPEHVERDQWYTRLWRSSKPVYFDAGPESSPRLALGLRSGDERVGSVWIVGDRDALLPGSVDALVASAPALATAVATATGISLRSREQRARTLSRVLAEAPGEKLDALLPAVVVAFTGTDEFDDLVRARLVDMLSLQAQHREGAGLAGEIDGVVTALIAWTSEDRLQASLGSLLDRTGGQAVAAVVSEPVATGNALREAHAQVRSLLSVQRHADDPPVRFAARSRPLVKLVRIGAACDEWGGLSAGPAATLSSHDEENGTAYAESLLAWLDSHGDVARAASRLHVHANTLRYRWNRAVQLFDLDVTDGDARLLLHLELRLRSLGYGRRPRPSGPVHGPAGRE